MDYLQRLSFETMHTPGETNMLADALLRLYEDIQEKDIEQEDIVQEETKDINTGLFALVATVNPKTSTDYLKNRLPNNLRQPSSSLQHLSPPSHLHATKMPRYYKKEYQCNP